MDESWKNGRPPCRFCGQGCLTVLKGLTDIRFGAPGVYDVIRCQKCGLEQTWPRLPEAELSDLYAGFYNWGGRGGGFYSTARRRVMGSALYRLWLKWDGDVFFHLRQGSGRLLDIGCNEGRGLAFYTKNGFQAEGLEINARAAARAREQGFTVHTVPLAEFKPESLYDVIVLSNVLEHVPEPVDLLAQVRDLLAPTGQVWISCPNAASFWRRVFRRYWINWHVPYHLWHFSPERIERLLTLARLHPVQIRTTTPAISIANSLCACLDNGSGRGRRLMKFIPLMASQMLLIRSLLQPYLRRSARLMQGDFLVLTAVASQEGALNA